MTAAITPTDHRKVSEKSEPARREIPRQGAGDFAAALSGFRSCAGKVSPAPLSESLQSELGARE